MTSIDPSQAGPRSAAPSMTSVARHAGVSIATVSRILNGIENKASPDTVAKVRRAIEELGYRPMSVGRALRHGQSRLVALLAANLANPAMAAIAASAETALRDAGFVMVLCDTHDRPDLQDEYLLEMRAQLVRGIVLLGAVDSPQLRGFVEAEEPRIVFVNRRDPGGGPAPFVGIDNEAAGAEVAEFFLARGVTDLAVVHGPVQSSATAARIASFTRRLAADGIVLSPDRIVTDEGLDHLRIGYRGVGRLLAQRGRAPAGLFCLSDLIAYGAHRMLLERDRSRGSGVLLVGFDDNPLNDWVAPWLSSVKVPYADFGQAILDAVVQPDLLAGSDTVLPHLLVDRTS